MTRLLDSNDQPASITARLGVAKAVLSAMVDLQSHVDLEDRLRRLEGMADA
jgi:hypothetical protein